MQVQDLHQLSQLDRRLTLPPIGRASANRNRQASRARHGSPAADAQPGSFTPASTAGHISPNRATVPNDELDMKGTVVQSTYR